MLFRLTVDYSLAASTCVIENEWLSRGLPERISYAGRTCSVSSLRIDEGHSLNLILSSPKMVSLRIGPAVAEFLHLPMQPVVHGRIHNDCLELGVCLGLYANMFDAKKRKFGEQTNMFQELTLLGREMGVDVVILTPGFSRSRCVWRYHPVLEMWETVVDIFPDVVIRRSGSFWRNEGILVKEDLNHLITTRRMHSLPRICSNKWLLYRALSSMREVRPMLPYTSYAGNVKEVYAQVLDRKNIYVKPLTGSQGVSVYHLYQAQNEIHAIWEERMQSRYQDRISSQFNPETRLRHQKFTKYSQFIQFWKQTGLRKCIVQNTIELCKLPDGRPVDFRWLIQGSDAPEMIARVARIGKKNAVTTNIHTGGEARLAEDVLKKLGIRNIERIILQMDRCAFMISSALAKKYGHFAELGIDLALDQNLNIWLFEVNPTPGRRMLRSISIETRKLSLQRLLEYAIRATGYAET